MTRQEAWCRMYDQRFICSDSAVHFVESQCCVIETLPWLEANVKEWSWVDIDNRSPVHEMDHIIYQFVDARDAMLFKLTFSG